MKGQHYTQMYDCRRLLSTYCVAGTMLEGALQLVYFITIGAKEVILPGLQYPTQ